MVYNPNAPKLPLGTLKEISNQLLAQKSLRAIARTHSIDHMTLLHRLQRAGLPTKPRVQLVLTRREREIMRMRDLDKMSTADIAQKLGITTICVRSHCYHARLKMRHVKGAAKQA